MKDHNRATLVALIHQLEATRGPHVALAEATRWAVTEEIDRLLASGVDPNVRLENNLTPLMYAGTRKSTECLLKAGADPNATDDSGYTPLIWLFKGVCAKREAISWAKMLLSHGADPHIVDHSGKTALDYASAKHDANVLDLLK